MGSNLESPGWKMDPRKIFPGDFLVGSVLCMVDRRGGSNGWTVVGLRVNLEGGG